MKFSILIPAYNEEKSISTCLDSLLSVTYPDKEIIVIDDASSDHTVKEVETFASRGVILVKREKNGGRAAALNSGLSRATGEIVVTTDADTGVSPHWLTLFERHFADEEVIAVGGAYKAQNKGNPLANATSVLDQILNGTFRKTFIPNKVSGVNSAIRRDTLLDLGGFNESAWWSEDSELGWKLDKTGKVIYDPENVVYTQYPDTWEGIWRRKFYWGYAMGLKFRQHMPFRLKLWIRPTVFMALFVSLVVFLATIPCGMRVYFVPGLFFGTLLSALTLVYVPIGAIVMIRTGDTGLAKTLPLLAILPIFREFAYVYGMFLGYCKGKPSALKPSWKRKQGKKKL
ncbi:putative membrane protein [Candidatus Kuenenia stuttgartiensis]|jgi:cellulose synthase/poly-beta-1,6-N-acetylglucosamine synthase-like glycosyltransferase|uniref:Putative membrane protein n=1 Tax=Kuenenia stuttgartiensis TaxID=174633 RepID=Q1PUL2_KUEST|nr:MULTISPECIES: glycosyltransferase family 2 protein [Kuenenia]MBE7548169.1 glycosyltransferase family 2 protein [Planctomycetia bacterium]MBW7941823.1 glycosyltransferase family 2 protein [Candidatus Kuenenia stuttgartiensis]MBZ0192710.1 glycosyltransferase family 2 protein [Candidatus Kuenenia stuttgartiensis]MCF6152606.1 glycosyltransferase family 2 protein [Candidatus Kuenenia stuttgartiensis]MCL4726890.1 glycosyltransferase family 2 protein [Candidatus Kuenenia stuttgartiensis]